MSLPPQRQQSNSSTIWFGAYVPGEIRKHLGGGNDCAFAIAVYVAIAELIASTGEGDAVEAPISHIANRAGLRYRKTQEVLSSLEGAGLIEAIEPKGPRAAKTYRLAHGMKARKPVVHNMPNDVHNMPNDVHGTTTHYVQTGNITGNIDVINSSLSMRERVAQEVRESGAAWVDDAEERERFLDHYEIQGWTRKGGAQIANWALVAKQWEPRGKGGATTPKATGPQAPRSPWHIKEQIAAAEDLLKDATHDVHIDGDRYARRPKPGNEEQVKTLKAKLQELRLELATL